MPRRGRRRHTNTNGGMSSLHCLALRANYRALSGAIAEGASYCQMCSLRSFAGGYDCCALWADVEAFRLRIVICGRCPRVTARMPPPRHHALRVGAVFQTTIRERSFPITKVKGGTTAIGTWLVWQDARC